MTLPSVNGLHFILTKIALFIYLIENWVECMTSSATSFAYFTHFSNLNISGANTDFLLFHGSLCNTPEKSTYFKCLLFSMQRRILLKESVKYAFLLFHFSS